MACSNRLVSASLLERRLSFPSKWVDAAVATGIPTAHPRTGKARTIAPREFGLADLDQAKDRRIHNRCLFARLILDQLELGVPYPAYGDFRAIATADLDRCRFRGEATLKRGCQAPRRGRLSCRKHCLQLLALPRIRLVIDDHANCAVTAGKVFRQIDEPIEPCGLTNPRRRIFPCRWRMRVPPSAGLGPAPPAPARRDKLPCNCTPQSIPRTAAKP